MEQEKIVEFEDWCKKCKHHDLLETEDPCFDCLDDPVNTHSHKPTKWEEDK